jgi:transglycosylase-like protein with SLT domain
VRPFWAVVAAPVGLVVLLGGGFAAQDDTAQASESSAVTAGVNLSAVPDLARQMLPLLQQRLDADCPELPALWVVAETQAESGWDARAFSPAGAAGLLQFMPGSWVSAGGPGGGWPTSTRPPAGHPVWDPTTHLAVGVPFMCANLRLVTAHLHRTGKPTSPLDALAVCHIAGCSRVTGSASGIPRPGEAGCGAGCVQQVSAYLAAIHRHVEAFAAPVPNGGQQPVSGPGSARPYPAGATGCAVPDPSGTGGCVTGALAWLMGQVDARFGHLPVACWSGRGGDPYSDHPKGMACDYTMGRIGSYPGRADVARGWSLALWLRANAIALHVNYVIWQGRIWSRAHDAQGWRPYTGGGVYDSSGPTNGHYDHVHVSTTD